MPSSRLLVGAGSVLFAVGILEVFLPGLLPSFGSEGILIVIGVGVLLYAYTVARSRIRADQSSRETPTVERSQPTDVPGSSLDETLDSFPRSDVANTSIHSSTKAGLKRAVVAVLTRYENYSEAEAATQLREGTWTSEGRVAAFFDDDADSRHSLKNRLQSLVAGSESILYRVVDEVVATSPAAVTHRDTRESPTNEEEDQVGSEDNESHRETTVTSGAVKLQGATTSGARQETDHWTGVGFVVLLCIGLGILTRTPAILLGAIVGIGYLAYARLLPLGSVELSITRAVSDTEPEPEDEIAVTVTVENRGTEWITDLRLVDGVPELLTVTDGSPRRGCVLRPGEVVELSYTVEARRGTHEFGPMLALVRNLSGSIEQTLYLADESSETLRCVPSACAVQQSVPLRRQVIQYTGQVDTDTAGEGLAFQSIREYQPGDPLTQIDWNRRARTGELTTLQFREERTATVVVAVDTSQSAYVGPRRTGAPVVDRAVSGAGRVFTRLLDGGNQVGIVSLGPRDGWLPPGTGTTHRYRGIELLGTDAGFSSVPPSNSDQSVLWMQRILRRLPRNAQLVVFTPLCDRQMLHSLRTLEAHGHPVTVISPDPTVSDTPTQRLMRVSRGVLRTDLRQSGIPVFDWQRGEKLEAALAHGLR